MEARMRNNWTSRMKDALIRQNGCGLAVWMKVIQWSVRDGQGGSRGFVDVFTLTEGWRQADRWTQADKGEGAWGRKNFLYCLYFLSLLCCLGTVALEVEKLAERCSRGRIRVEDAVCMLIKLNANWKSGEERWRWRRHQRFSLGLPCLLSAPLCRRSGADER